MLYVVYELSKFCKNFIYCSYSSGFEMLEWEVWENIENLNYAGNNLDESIKNYKLLYIKAP